MFFCRLYYTVLLLYRFIPYYTDYTVTPGTAEHEGLGLILFIPIGI